MTTALTIHPFADIVPPMTPDEFAELKADIKAHGLHEPITLYEGKILDGKHRYRACMALGVPFKTRNWRKEDGSPAEYVISENVKRRHLSVGQKAAFAVAFAEELREVPGAQRPGWWRREGHCDAPWEQGDRSQGPTPRRGRSCGGRSRA